jgi:Plasmid pRiA4b ORF-3-like protein
MGKRVYQLQATILRTKPPVWRRVVVSETTTLARLHDVLQAAFGWWDYHLHEFEIDGVRYGIDDGEGWGEPPKDERRARLRDVVGEGSSFKYVYDFGDNWEHRIVVEKVMAAERRGDYPACTGGARACPPEDCGGVWGYADFLEAIADPQHAEHESMLQWVGGSFDPDAFDTSDFDHRRELGRLVAP